MQTPRCMINTTGPAASKHGLAGHAKHGHSKHSLADLAGVASKPQPGNL